MLSGDTPLEPFYRAIATEAYVRIGAFRKPVGDRGGLVVHFSDGLCERALRTLPALFVARGHLKIPYRIQEVLFADDKAIVSLEYIQTKTEAYALNGLPIFLPESLSATFFKQPPLQAALVGFLVEDARLGALGSIQKIHAVRDQYLLDVDCQGKSLLIPYQAPFILRKDAKKRKVEVALPEGYLEALLP